MQFKKLIDHIDQSDVNDIIAALDRAMYDMTKLAIDNPTESGIKVTNHLYHLREMRNALLKETIAPFNKPD